MTAQQTQTGSVPAMAGVMDEWLGTQLPGVFARAHQWIVVLQRASSEAIIAAADVAPGDHAIDIGCGSGVPTIMLAGTVGQQGRVTAVDPSSVFIEALAKNVHEAGLDNVDIVQASAMTLPFADASFDAATCHFGAMFFPDLPAGLASIRRVLKPGARAGFAGWGPIEENSHLRPYFEILARHLGPRPSPPNPREAPWPMRFAIPGTLSAGLEAAGYDDIREEQPLLKMTWPGKPETLLTFWMELANLGPDVPADTRTAIESDLLAHLREIEDADGLHFTASVTVGSGRNPA